MAETAAGTSAHAGKDVPVAKLAVASTIGTIIEAYDFVLMGQPPPEPEVERQPRFVRDREPVRERVRG